MAIREFGEIIETRGDKAIIRIHRSESCEDCSSKGTCPLSATKNWEVEVENTLSAAVGERVELELGSGAYLASGFIVFILPIILMVIFYLIANYIVKSSYSPLFSFVGLLAGMMVAFLFNRGKGARRFEFRMIEKA